MNLFVETIVKKIWSGKVSSLTICFSRKVNEFVG